MSFAPDKAPQRRVATVVVPATSANLGSAFDCAALAFGLYNEVTLELADHDDLSVEGEGEGEIGLDSQNLVVVAARKLFLVAGKGEPRLRVVMRNRIPLGRGLGSSSAAIVAGLMSANALLGSCFTLEQLLHHAVEIEGHGDNVCAALFGGLTLYVDTAPGGIPIKLPVPRRLRAVVFVPEQRLPTSVARAVLPEAVPRADALYNVARSALLVAAFSRGHDTWLREAMRDRLHQPYRAPLFPAGLHIVRSALDAGAAGSAISGAGPSVLALVSDGATAEAVSTAMARAAASHRVPGMTLVTSVTRTGARIVL